MSWNSGHRPGPPGHDHEVAWGADACGARTGCGHARSPFERADLVVSQLTAFSEHHCDFGVALPLARTLRERVDWTEVRRSAEGRAMAEAFLFLLERLDAAPDGTRDRVEARRAPADGHGSRGPAR